MSFQQHPPTPNPLPPPAHASCPSRVPFPQVYLDMLGESANSARRAAGRGAHMRQRLLEDAAGRAIDAYFLDEHFDRAPLPCHHVAASCALLQHAHTVRLPPPSPPAPCIQRGVRAAAPVHA